MKTLCLGDIIQCVRGVATPVSREGDNPAEDMVTCIRSGNIQVGLDLTERYFVSAKKVRNEEQYIRAQDILMVMRGANLGKCIYLDNLDFPATIDITVSILRVQSSDINPLYLFYWLQSPPVQFRIKHETSEGVSIPAINYNALLKMQLSVPSKNEQDDIAKNFDKISKFCKKQQEIVRLAEKLSETYALRVFAT